MPNQRLVIEKRREDLEINLENSRKQMRHIELEKKSLELEVKSKQQLIQRYREQQAKTRKNEEFQALNHEISLVQAEIVKLEDRELELMEEAENLKPHLQKADADYKAGLQEIQEQLIALDYKKDSLQKLLSDLQNKRSENLSSLETDLAENYERLLKTKNGLAIARLHNDVCRGCWMKVPRETALLVEACTEIVTCPNCGRILTPFD
ncbi:MAG: C4-type zinc ribbon domain-containing protein [Chthoniobacterales bacterium]|nr:C4-type zinc ribbon domain-containing protein [Chthoniobacterales bacterium]